ncbi:MAG: hypothetical protein PHC38_12540 [Weeksellaceae bacterium]|nr:hypothetical protein [Weeksellaceae bacterium]
MFEELKKNGFFEYFWQIYVTAPLLGFIYKRKTDTDKAEQSSTIFLAQLTPRQETIYFIYKLLLLADENHAETPEERIKKAFSTIDTEEAKPDEQLFYSYLLGGVEILYEKLIEKSSDQIKNLEKFIEEINIPDDSLTEELGINL